MTNFPPFGPPQGFTPAAPAAPAPAFGAPLSSAQALAGLGGADVESRCPFLPPGAAVRMKVARTYERTVNKIGLCYFVEGLVTDVATPGGPEHWPQTKNPMPSGISICRQGGEYSCRVSGIGAAESMAAALREYRELLCALWAHRGLTQNFGKDKLAAAQASGDPNAVAAVEREIAETFWRYGVMTAQYEAIIAGRAQGDRAMAEQFKAEIEGRHILVNCSVYVSKAGNGKLKCNYFADVSANVVK